MRIDNTLPAFYTQLTQAPAMERYSAAGINAPAGQGRISLPDAPQTNNVFRPGIVVDISPEGWAAYARSKAAAGEGAKKIAATDQVCQTCQNRRYKDVSNDPSVSFQTPTHISPGQSASMVMAHEREHVSNEQARADRDGRKVISQSVTLETSICPECGRVYVSGGVTRTVTAQDNENGTPPIWG